MGLFDTFTFSPRNESLPEGLPRNNWQTKDLDSVMHEYWVDGQGRVARKGYRGTGYFYSETAAFTAYIYQEVQGRRVTLKLVVVNGYVRALTEEEEEKEAGITSDWNIPAAGPDIESG